MDVGTNIRKFRENKGYTQKQLADKLYVTPQAVSRWEKGEIEPNLDILHKMCSIFSCKIEDLIYGVKEEVEEVVTPIPSFTPKQSHVCEYCHNVIPEAELYVHKFNVDHPTRSGRRTIHHYSSKENYYHKRCFYLHEKEEKAAQEKARQAKIKKSKKTSFGWGIFAGVVGLGISLGVFLANTQSVHPALGVFLSILIGYALFAELYCILSGSYVGEVFVSVSGWSIRLPGLIATFDLEGFAWLIVMKIAFAIIGFMFGIFVLGLAIALSTALAAISFPFVLAHNVHTGYDDSLV